MRSQSQSHDLNGHCWCITALYYSYCFLLLRFFREDAQNAHRPGQRPWLRPPYLAGRLGRGPQARRGRQVGLDLDPAPDLDPTLDLDLARAMIKLQQLNLFFGPKNTHNTSSLDHQTCTCMLLRTIACRVPLGAVRVA